MLGELERGAGGSLGGQESSGRDPGHTPFLPLHMSGVARFPRRGHSGCEHHRERTDGTCGQPFQDPKSQCRHHHFVRPCVPNPAGVASYNSLGRSRTAYPVPSERGVLEASPGVSSTYFPRETAREQRYSKSMMYTLQQAWDSRAVSLDEMGRYVCNEGQTVRDGVLLPCVGRSAGTGEGEEIDKSRYHH
jgi:hypothetical protein